ncbi:MAG: hypothetical protein M9885_12690 [Burkholderiaceae bacterium]|nr:hypothetical protein [Burkholderiaceae bacterium]
MSSDPGAGAPAVVAPACANVVVARNSRISPELLAAIAVVGVAANGHLTEAALAASVVAFGWAASIGSRSRAKRAATRDGDVERQAHAATTMVVRGPVAARVPVVERVLSAFAAWFMPFVIALSAAVLMRSGDVTFALTLLLVASPQTLLALPASSRRGTRALAASTATLLLAAVLAGFVGFVAAAVLHRVSMAIAYFAPRFAPDRKRDRRPN